jgi:hypothetical protein
MRSDRNLRMVTVSVHVSVPLVPEARHVSWPAGAARTAAAAAAAIATGQLEDAVHADVLGDEVGQQPHVKRDLH